MGFAERLRDNAEAKRQNIMQRCGARRVTQSYAEKKEENGGGPGSSVGLRATELNTSAAVG